MLPNRLSKGKEMTFRDNEPVSAKTLSDLREAVGWNRMDNEYGNPLLTSYYHIAAYENDELIGYIDCVSNSVTDAYIQDLMVHPDHQGKGIGTALMNRMMEVLKDRRIYMISVVFDESLKSFYSRFGFNLMLCGQMETYGG